MEIWKLIWVIVLLGGLASFVYISLLVITRGLAELKTLLEEMVET